MRTFLLIIAALIIVPTAEIAVLLYVGSLIGPGWTVLLLLLSAVVGGWALRRETTKAIRAWRTASREGRPPAVETAEGVVVVTGGLMMMLPGFLTDLLGLLLLLPPVRIVAGRALLRGTARRLPPEVGAALLESARTRPRRVRSRRGRATDEYTETVPTPSSAPHRGAVIEGEITP